MHPNFYSFPGSMIIQVEDILYGVDIRILNHFQVFRDMFQHASEFNSEKDEGRVDENPIRLEGVTAYQFESLLKLFDLSNVFESNIQTCEFWEAILHIATMWDSDRLRQHAIQEIDKLKPNALRYIHLSKTYNVLKWMEPAYVQLCKKPEPISEEEAASISLPLLLEICQVRERRAAISGHSTCSQCLQPRWMSSSGRSTSTCSKCGCYMTAEGVVEQGAKKLRDDN